jgi:hypothetical protein
MYVRRSVWPWWAGLTALAALAAMVWVVWMFAQSVALTDPAARSGPAQLLRSHPAAAAGRPSLEPAPAPAPTPTPSPAAEEEAVRLRSRIMA